MTSTAVTLADIESADWSLCLDSTAGGGSGSGIGQVVQGVADIEQCIGIILTTPPGADPFRPTFGLDPGLYVDVPIQQATPALVGAAKTALETWEPRITVVSISVQTAAAADLVATGFDASTLGHVTVFITWQLKGSATQQTTAVTI
jgi:phage baseplate assembly protein W